MRLLPLHYLLKGVSLLDLPVQQPGAVSKGPLPAENLARPDQIGTRSEGEA